jgi:ribA/ribD-fused uncharacterized protein
MAKITSFTGYYRFLSNFYACKVKYEGVVYPSSEHAYVAAKTTNQIQKLSIAETESAAEVKRLGKSIELRPDWKSVKVFIMKCIVEAKFDQNHDLMKMLQETRSYELIEGNNWGDKFWGESPLGNGRNELGKILMSVRDDITRF